MQIFTRTNNRGNVLVILWFLIKILELQIHYEFGKSLSTFLKAYDEAILN